MNEQWLKVGTWMTEEEHCPGLGRGKGGEANGSMQGGQPAHAST